MPPRDPRLRVDARRRVRLRARAWGRAALASGLLACMALLSAAPASAAEVLIVGETQYRPVADVVAAIGDTLRSPAKVYTTSEVRGRLAAVVAGERARLVVALGKDALKEAVRLPLPTRVVYGLVIVPPKVTGSNVTGVYMATPVREYVDAVRRYLPAIKRISVFGSEDLLGALDGESLHVNTYGVSSPSELVSTLEGLDGPQAILLLPDVTLITGAVMERAYLFSYRKNVPLLGISEGHVRQGALFALVFDPASLGRQIGEEVAAALDGKAIAAMPPSPPRSFDLCINTETAKRMGIAVPEEMLKRAKRTYP
jgi:putative tryptophan/tyrosine transport system substrate-binding protein